MPNNTHGQQGVEACVRSFYLGSHNFAEADCNEFVATKVLEWKYTIEELAMVVSQQNPHSQPLPVGVTKSLQHRWTHNMQRAISGIAPLFILLEETITDSFLSPIYREVVSNTICLWSALSVKSTGLAIIYLSTPYSVYTSSTLLCLHLSQAVQGKIEFCPLDHSGGECEGLNNKEKW